jgi:hypothetical protein
MAIQQASFFCPVCQQQRLFTRQQSVNHILHLLGTFLSCGLWGFVWMLLVLTHHPKYHCSQCGHAEDFLATRNRVGGIIKEAQPRAERARLSAHTNPFVQWFTSLGTGHKVFVIGIAFLTFSVVVGFFSAIMGLSPSSNRQSNTNTNIAANVGTASATPAVALKTSPTPSRMTGKCADIESDLALVESDQARVEQMLDATEDFGDQAGSPKREIYMNALKRKGELQQQHIALERKLRACRKRK